MTEPRAGRHFSNWIEACVHAVPNTPIPEVFRRWAAISAVAGAMGRRCWYDFGAFTVSTNMYIILVAEPGRGKSVSLLIPFDNVFRKLAVAVDATAPRENQQVDTGWEYGYADFGMTRPFRFIQDRVTPEQLTVDMAGISEEIGSMSTFDAPFFDSSLTMVTSEFGAFMSQDDKNLQIFMTDVWDGRPEVWYRTKTSGKFRIKGPCLNWIAGATPEQFVANMPDSARSQGLLSRILPVWYDGQHMNPRIEYPKPDAEYINHLREDLATISAVNGRFVFENDEMRKNIDEWLQKGMEPRPSDPNMKEYNERRVAHLVKLAMAVSAAHSNNMVITREHWQIACETLFAVEDDMPKALRLFGMSHVGKSSLELADVVQSVFSRNAKGLTVRHFKSLILGKAKSFSDVNTMVAAMSDAGYIKIDAEQKFVLPGPLLSKIGKETSPDQKPADSGAPY